VAAADEARPDITAETVIAEADEQSTPAASETYGSYPIPPPELGENNTDSGLFGSRVSLVLAAAVVVAAAVRVWVYLRSQRAQAHAFNRVQKIAGRLRRRSAVSLDDGRTTTGAKLLPILLTLALWAWRVRRSAR
jgi:hypothetical protein